MSAIPPAYLRAAQRYGHLVDGIARQYVNPVTGRPLSGTALLLKLGKGENHFSMQGVSPAGARGSTQFTPGSRKVAIQKFGLDPWRSTDEAVHAAALHLLGKINGSKGLSGYNPGDPSYVGYILGQRIGRTGAVLPSGGVGHAHGPSNGSSAPSPGLVDPGQPSDVTGLLSALMSQAHGPTMTLPDAPSYAAGVQFPKGFQDVPVSDTVQSPSLADLLPLIAQSGGDLPDFLTGGGSDVPNPPPGHGGHHAASVTPGKLIIAPGATSKGPLAQPLLDFVRNVAGRSKKPITLTTGTNHDRLTVGGRVSDHSDGHAGDFAVPVDSKQGDLLAAHALVEAGIPWHRAYAMARRGGLWNVNSRGRRIQIIWKTDGPNIGNHHDHVHIGVRPL